MSKAAKNTQTQFDNLAHEAANYSREQMDAVAKSGAILTKGLEEIMKTCVALCQVNAEKGSEAFKSMLACKTLDEVTSTQNKFAQQSFDDFMAGATKISEIGVKCATECLEPINDQFNKTIKKASESMAA